MKSPVFIWSLLAAALPAAAHAQELDAEPAPPLVEIHGKETIVFLSREALDDLGRHRGNTTDAQYLKTFEKHRGAILDGVTEACQDKKNYDREGRLHVRGENIPKLRY